MRRSSSTCSMGAVAFARRAARAQRLVATIQLAQLHVHDFDEASLRTARHRADGVSRSQRFGELSVIELATRHGSDDFAAKQRDRLGVVLWAEIQSPKSTAWG
jgi:hypothetical protein